MKRALILLFSCFISLIVPGGIQSAQRASQPAQSHLAAQAEPHAAAQREIIVSPQVDPDHRVTFRFRDPNAHQVMLALEGFSPQPMQKGVDGVWRITTAPLAAEFYGYTFVADGVNLVDPSNSLIKPNLLGLSSMVHVPGPPSLPWEVNDVPHGVIHHHFYHSTVVGDDRDYYVYTPPGYDPAARKKYPVFYLLHGYSDDASAWTAVGHANVIFDNLLAKGKMQPMIVVMTLGYGAPAIVQRGGPGFRNKNLRQENLDKFREALFSEVMPRIQKEYRLKTGRDNTAIAGLSMGGGESLDVGLNNLDHFAWIGSFSGAVGFEQPDLAQEFPQLSPQDNSRIRLLWVACGKDDLLVGRMNRRFERWLTAQKIQFTEIWTPGTHSWLVWRDNLAHFAPLLFQHYSR